MASRRKFLSPIMRSGASNFRLDDTRFGLNSRPAGSILAPELPAFHSQFCWAYCL